MLSEVGSSGLKVPHCSLLGIAYILFETSLKVFTVFSDGHEVLVIFKPCSLVRLVFPRHTHFKGVQSGQGFGSTISDSPFTKSQRTSMPGP